MLAQLQTIFKNSVNFSRGVHRGDNFSFLYKEYYVNGKKYRSGDIVAAEFIHDGKTYRAVRYQYSNGHIGYFTPDGHGLEARFLNAPLNYKRISSRFSLHRWDPVLHQVRAHLGVDYAARSGTPIKSIGDGNVIFMGREHGFGRMIKIRYDRHQVALYAHLNRYAHLQMHQFVHKGEIIGYVGESGWATGPHLHFGFYVDGKPCNWLAMKMPTGQSIPARVRKQFLATSRQLFAQLQLYRDTQLAVNNAKIVKHPRS
jgi:murein DD-endopeptidase MepM/ murein hydrolase activator NlpD